MDNINKKFETKLNTENGTLTIDLLDVIRNLNEEERQELMHDGGYWIFVTDGLLHDIKEMFAGNSYNSDIHKIREAILTSEYIPSILKEFAEGLVRDYIHEIRYRKEYQDAYYKIYHHPAMQEKWAREIVNGSHIRQDNPLSKTDWVSKFIDNMLTENNIIDEE